VIDPSCREELFDEHGCIVRIFLGEEVAAFHRLPLMKRLFLTLLDSSSRVLVPKHLEKERKKARISRKGCPKTVALKRDGSSERVFVLWYENARAFHYICMDGFWQ
jgi:hypothetical protein